MLDKLKILTQEDYDKITKRGKMKQALLKLGAMILFAPGLVLAEDCITGVNAYVDNDYKKAAEIFRSLAKKGDACAQFQLGMMHYFGHGVEKNNEQAREWMEKAAKGGFEKAKIQLKLLK